MVIVKCTEDSKNEVALPDPQLMTDINKFNDDLLEAGVLIGYDGLHPSSNGARVHFSGKNRPIVTDGPFAESKEVIASFWFWQVKSLEEAIEWVKRSPNEGETDMPRSASFRARKLRICFQRRRNSEGKTVPRSNGSERSQEIVPVALSKLV